MHRQPAPAPTRRLPRVVTRTAILVVVAVLASLAGTVQPAAADVDRPDAWAHLFSAAREEVAALHLVPNDGRIIRFGDDEVRAFVFNRLLVLAEQKWEEELEPPSTLSPQDLAAVEAFEELLRQRRIQSATLAITEYGHWHDWPCGYQPPAGFPTHPNPGCEDHGPIGNIFVPPPHDHPPSAAQFSAYGHARAHADFYGNPEAQANLEGMISTVAAFGAVAAAAASGGAVAIAVTASTAFAASLAGAIAPFSVLSAGTGFVTVAAMASFSVVFIAVLAIFVIALVLAKFVETSSIPANLSVALSDAWTTTPNVHGLAQSGDGLRELWVGFLNAVPTRPRFHTTGGDIPITMPGDPGWGHTHLDPAFQVEAEGLPAGGVRQARITVQDHDGAAVDVAFAAGWFRLGWPDRVASNRLGFDFLGPNGERMRAQARAGDEEMFVANVGAVGPGQPEAELTSVLTYRTPEGTTATATVVPSEAGPPPPPASLANVDPSVTVDGGDAEPMVDGGAVGVAEGSTVTYRAVADPEHAEGLTFEWAIRTTGYTGSTLTFPPHSSDPVCLGDEVPLSGFSRCFTWSYASTPEVTVGYSRSAGRLLPARLTVTNSDGESVVVEVDAEVANVAPVLDDLTVGPAIGPDVVVDVFDVVTVAGTVNDPGGPGVAASVRVDWGDGTTSNNLASTIHFGGLINDGIPRHPPEPVEPPEPGQPIPIPVGAPAPNPRDVSFFHVYETGTPEGLEHTITIRTNDEDGGVAEETRTVTVREPFAPQDDVLSGVEGQPIAFTVGDLLANDVNYYETPVIDSFELDSDPSHGHVEHDTDGPPHGYRYVPDDGFNGTDSFTYSVCLPPPGPPPGPGDDCGRRESATVEILVAPLNDAPLAEDSSVTVDEGGSVDVDLAALVSDAETPTEDLTYEVTQGTGGSVSLTGAVATYVPNPGWSGIDTFDYSVTDGGDPHGCGEVAPGCAGPETSTATVTVTVRGSQTITFDELDPVAFGPEPFDVEASASSGLAVALTAEGDCTIDDATVAVTGVGTCTITATQPGDGNWLAADPVVVTVTVAPAGTTLSLSGPSGPTIVGAPVGFTATVAAPPGTGTPVGTVTFTAGGGDVEVPLGADGTATWTTTELPVGAVTVTATYGGRGDHAGSVAASVTHTVDPIPPSGFVDVARGTYFAAAVDWARRSGVTTGVGGTNNFEPFRDATRAEAVTMLWRAAGSPVVTAPHGFVDVPAGAYYAPAVRWAKATGVTTGIGGGDTFAPHDTMDRAQNITFLWRYLDTPDVPTPHGFVDVPDRAYYAPAVRWAKATGVTTGIGGGDTFAPHDNVDRAQAVTSLHRLHR